MAVLLFAPMAQNQASEGIAGGLFQLRHNQAPISKREEEKLIDFSFLIVKQ